MIQLIIVILVTVILWRTAWQWRKSDITGREFFVWVVFWSAIALASFVPKQADKFAQIIGVERGADLFVYFSIIILFFVVFKILVRQQSIQREITKIVRKNALANPLEGKDNEVNINKNAQSGRSDSDI